jgi:hypothetical protein
VSLQSDAARTFEAAEAAGTTIAEAVIAARLEPCDGPIRASVGQTELVIAEDPQVVGAAKWRAISSDDRTDPATAALMRCWADWATRPADASSSTWTARVGVLEWGGVRIVTLPGEPFAHTGQQVRAALGPGVTFVAGYTDGSPGYLASACEYELGGYEVLEAHRYYGMPGPFARGSAEQLVKTALALFSGA